jgi:hypothetical protein
LCSASLLLDGSTSRLWLKNPHSIQTQDQMYGEYVQWHCLYNTRLDNKPQQLPIPASDATQILNHQQIKKSKNLQPNLHKSCLRVNVCVDWHDISICFIKWQQNIHWNWLSTQITHKHDQPLIQFYSLINYEWTKKQYYIQRYYVFCVMCAQQPPVNDHHFSCGGTEVIVRLWTQAKHISWNNSC